MGSTNTRMRRARRQVLCAAESCAERRRRAEPGRALCHVCAERIAEHLGTIADAWPDLLDQLDKLTKVAEFVTGTPDRGLPFNEAVADHRRAVTDWCWFLARDVIEQRAWRSTLPTTVWSPATVCQWLARYHAGWIAGHDDHEWVAKVADKADAYAYHTRQLAYPSGARQFPVAPCPGGDPFRAEFGPAGPCDSTLYAIVRPKADLLPSELFCKADPPHTYPARKWMLLGERLHRQGESEPCAAS